MRGHVTLLLSIHTTKSIEILIDSLNMEKQTQLYLRQLESNAIFIIREFAAVFKKPVLLFSGGKDSIVLAHLCRKAFYPTKIPFPFLHIDSGFNFPEIIEFRDKFLKNELQVDLIVRSTNSNQKNIQLETKAFLATMSEIAFDASLCGARRSDEKAQAKERIFSHRNKYGKWNPENQRPEIRNTFNVEHNLGEAFRVFPMSDWTEIDLWRYIVQENIELPSLYYAHYRDMINSDGILLPYNEKYHGVKKREISKELIRFRTVSDATNSGAIRSFAFDAKEVLVEVSKMRLSERSANMTDKSNKFALEELKSLGHF